jgi:hypothetical protein
MTAGGTACGEQVEVLVRQAGGLARCDQQVEVVMVRGVCVPVRDREVDVAPVERRMPRLAASLADQAPVTLGEAVTGSTAASSVS